MPYFHRGGGRHDFGAGLQSAPGGPSADGIGHGVWFCRGSSVHHGNHAAAHSRNARGTDGYHDQHGDLAGCVIVLSLELNSLLVSSLYPCRSYALDLKVQLCTQLVGKILSRRGVYSCLAFYRVVVGLLTACPQEDGAFYSYRSVIYDGSLLFSDIANCISKISPVIPTSILFFGGHSVSCRVTVALLLQLQDSKDSFSLVLFANWPIIIHTNTYEQFSNTKSPEFRFFMKAGCAGRCFNVYC